MREEPKEDQVFYYIDEWLGAIQKEAIRNPGCEVKLAEDPKIGVFYELIPPKMTKGKSFTIRLARLKEEGESFGKRHPVVREYLKTERGRYILGAVLSQGASLQDLPVLLDEANKVWEENKPAS